MKALFLAAGLASIGPAWADTTEWVRGEVVKLDPARSRITLRHGPIAIVKMAAMTMPFKVQNAEAMTALHAGDRVRFEVVEHDSELIVLRIEAER